MNQCLTCNALLSDAERSGSYADDARRMEFSRFISRSSVVLLKNYKEP
jgi:hypothetical protein